MSSLLLVGGGGHCRSCIDVIEAEGRFRIAGIAAPEAPTDAIYPFLGGDDELPRLVREFRHALVVVGQVKTPAVRIALFEKLRALSAELPSIVSPRGYVSRRATLGAGTIVMHGAIVNAAAVVGDNCIINTLSLLEHDVTVQSHCHISTGARLNGGVHVGEGSFIGSGAIVHEGVRIGARCVVAAGAVVRHPLDDGAWVRSPK